MDRAATGARSRRGIGRGTVDAGPLARQLAAGANQRQPTSPAGPASPKMVRSGAALFGLSRHLVCALRPARHRGPPGKNKPNPLNTKAPSHQDAKVLRLGVLSRAARGLAI